MRRWILLALLVGPAVSPAAETPLPAPLRGSWAMVSFQCGGKEVPKKTAATYQPPNSVEVRFEAETARSLWKAPKCLYQIFYSVHADGPDTLRGGPTGETRCEPANCLPKVCSVKPPKGFALPYHYQIKKKTLTVTSAMGLECLTSGLKGPAEMRFRRLPYGVDFRF